MSEVVDVERSAAHDLSIPDFIKWRIRIFLNLFLHFWLNFREEFSERYFSFVFLA